MSIEVVGSAAIGLVVGWILPIVTKRSPLALLASFLEASAVVAWIAVTVGAGPAAAAAAGMVIASTIHAAWRVQLAARPGRSLEERP